MLTIFLVLITLIFFILTLKNIESDTPLYVLYLFLFFISLGSIFIVPSIYKCSTYDKEIRLKIIDKYIVEGCNSKRKFCSRTYIFVLETEKGYKYETTFNIDSYSKFNIGDYITYTPTSCHESKLLFDK